MTGEATARLVGAAALIGLLSGCAVRVPPGRQEYVDAHPEISETRRVQILAGEVAEGMTPDEVRAAVGEPMHRREMSEDGRRVLLWTYPGALIFRSSALASREDQDFLAALIFRDGILDGIERR